MRTLTKKMAMMASVLAACAGMASGQILVIHNDSLTDYRPTSASALQDIRPLHRQRGVGIDGQLRAGSVQGWALNGNPFGDSAPSTSRIGDVNLSTGTYAPTDVDIALPQAGLARWVIGRSFNGRQETSSPAHRDSNAMQGFNWFQMSQPELKFFAGKDASGDLIHLIYGADRYAEFQRTGDSASEFLGTNGCAGVVQYDANGGGANPDLYVYFDQRGVKTYFWGPTNTGAKAWQIWKIVDPAGNVAYVGDATTASTALSSGYDSAGHITTAYDDAGRRYCYTYSSVGSVDRLTQVLVETDAGGGWGGCGDETLVAKVEYGYYTTNESDKGLIGDLKTVKITMPLTDSGITQVKTKYYRYYDQAYANSSGRRGEPHEVKMVVGYEGYRRYDWDQDSNLDDDPLSATDANLKAYADAYLEYADTAGSWPYYVSSGFFNGQCGCGGGSGNGTYSFTYANNGSFSPSAGYDTAWHDRAVIVQPDANYATQYFDECGQPLSRVVTNADPSGSPTKTWATEVVRDSTYPGAVIEIHTPANITAYTHSTGAFTRSSSVGLVNVFQRRSTSDAAKGFPEAVKYKEGNSGTAYFTSWTDYTSRDLSITSTSVQRPMVTERRSYYNATSTYSTGSTYDATTMSYAWWSGTSTNILYIAPKQATTTNPVVTTTQNGSNSATTMDRYIRKDGTTAFSVAPDGIFTFTGFTNGQLTTQNQDCKTNGSFPSGDDPNGDFGVTETSSGSDRITTYTYDAQGRTDEMTEPDGRVHKSYYSRLSDQRGVSINWPRKTTASGGTYYGPAGYSVTNQAGVGEFSGLIAISSSGSTAALTSWIDETTADPISAVTTGTLARMSTSILDSAGVRVSESRAYFLIPGSGAGSVGTNYDATKYVYDDMGRKIRTVDATGTITRVSFDELGRTLETHLGTDDTGMAGSPLAGSSNMVKTSKNEYDGGSAGGNSLLTSRTAYVEGSTTGQRVTSYQYDYRGRMLLTTNPQAPHTLTSYDNLGRAIASAQYTSTGSITVGTTDPAYHGTQSNRVALSRSYYDALGRVYLSERYKIDQSDGSDDDSLTTNTWRDAAGRTVKVCGEQLSKTYYDRLGRTTKQFVLAQDDDSGYGDVSTVAGDIVLTEDQSVYESTDSDNVVMRVHLDRWHDTYATIALDYNNDNNNYKLTYGNLNGRAQITALWYDDLDRVIDTVNYGDYGSGDFDRKPSGSWLTQPTRSQTALRTTTTYNDDGTVLETESPGQPTSTGGTSGVKTHYVYDALGRQTTVKNNYDVGVNSGNPYSTSNNQTITYAYANGLRTSITAVMPSGGTDQVTTYIYGTTSGTPSAMKITTKNLLRAVKYPDSTNVGTNQSYIDGTSDADVVSYAYNAQGQRTSVKDQAGTTLETTYDTGGRETVQTATALGSGIDGAVRRKETAYLSRGLVNTITQYDATSSGSVTDQVQYTYDDWGNIASFTQDPDSAIGGGGRASFAVSYTYSKATNGRQTVRRDTASYPGGSDLTYTYGSPGYGSISGMNDALSRVDFIYNGATMVSSYYYLGMGIVMSQSQNEPGIYQATNGAFGYYPDLDRFNRPIKNKLIKGVPSPTNFFDIDIAWDKSGVITSVVDNLRLDGIGGNHVYDVLYSSDDLGRLIKADEGKLTTGSITTHKRDEEWTLSHTGNWDTHKLDLNGDLDFSDSGELNVSDTFNVVNELTVRSGTSTAYDAAGNLTDDARDYVYVYDAWGRLKQVKTRGGSPVLKSEYTYNGLNYRIGWHYDANTSGTCDGSDPWFYLMYNERWQLLATFRGTDSDPKERFVYHAAGLGGTGGSSYIDDVISTDRDESSAFTAASDGVLEKRRYSFQNWRHDSVLVSTDTGKLVENTKYYSNGVGQQVPAGDVNCDNAWDATDAAAITGGYDVTKDANMDGTVDASDITDANAVNSGYYSSSLGAISVVNNRKGYASYELEPNLSGSKFHVRNRVLDGELGRWTRRDPLGYEDGMGLYAGAASEPIIYTDPFGLNCCCCATRLFRGIWATYDQPVLSPMDPITLPGHWCGYDVELRFEYENHRLDGDTLFAACQLQWWERYTYWSPQHIVTRKRLPQGRWVYYNPAAEDLLTFAPFRQARQECPVADSFKLLDHTGVRSDMGLRMKLEVVVRWKSSQACVDRHFCGQGFTRRFTFDFETAGGKCHRTIVDDDEGEPATEPPPANPGPGDPHVP